MTPRELNAVIRGCVARFGIRGAELEDLAQAVWVRILEYEGPWATAYAYATARTVVVDHMRRSSRRRRREDVYAHRWDHDRCKRDEDSEGPLGPDPTPQYESREILRMVDDLEPKLADTLVCRALGHGLLATGRLVGCAKVNVWRRQNKALECILSITDHGS